MRAIALEPKSPSLPGAPGSSPVPPRPDPVPDRGTAGTGGARTPPEVSISERARELRAASAGRRENATETQAQALEAAVAAAGLDARPDQVLAVRSGPAPIETLSKDPAAVIRETLEERASLRRVGAVLRTRELEPAASPDIALLGEGAGAAAPGTELRLPGSGTKRSEGVALPGSQETAAASVPRAADPRSEREESHRAERSAELRGDNRDHIDRASALASQTGAVRSADVDRNAGPDAIDLPGEADRPAGEKIAHRTLTQAGAVEARAEEQIVSRFVTGTRQVETGAEPRPRERLAERSVPLSTYA